MTREADGTFANKTQNFEAMAQYQFDFGLRPSLSYVQSKGKPAARGTFAGGDEDLQKYVEVGAYYYFNKNFNIYVDYQLNLIDNSDYSHSVGIVNGRRPGCDGCDLPVLISTLCYMLEKQGFGPVFLCLPPKDGDFKRRTLFVANGWQFVNLPLT
jgi:hypothetical protein